MTFAFILYRGDTAAKPLTLRDQDTKAALDLTGLTLTISGDTNADPSNEGTQLFKKTMTVTDAANGQCQFALTTSDWASIDPGSYFFDVQAVDGALAIQTLAKGRFQVEQDINKD